MSQKKNNFEDIVKGLLTEENLGKLVSLASTIGSQFINCDIFNQILDADPNLTDEFITEKINSYKKSHPDASEIIDKYLQSYQNNSNSKKSVYQIREFLKSGDCKKALHDDQVQQYLKDLFNSSQFQEKLQQIQK